jgi:hypothetical protein
MTSFSFDWNCVIEVEADGQHACQVRRLIDLDTRINLAAFAGM